MVWKIDSQSSAYDAVKSSRTNNKVVEEEVTTNKSSPNRDKVMISRSQAIMKELDVAELSSEREAKIKEIKKQVQSGDYLKNRTNGQIAEAFIDNINEEIYDLNKLFDMTHTKE
jgi:anti-sigma28 factor (negative regulator of flagellin synthesis)